MAQARTDTSMDRRSAAGSSSNSSRMLTDRYLSTWPFSSRRGSHDSDLNSVASSTGVAEHSYHLVNPDHGDSILSRLNYFRSSKLALSDLKIVVGQHEFPCHRFVMAASSPYFETMFSTDLREKMQKKIFFNDISPFTMKYILDFVYTGNLEITPENAQDLLGAASIFQYSHIIEACCQFLKRQLDPSNCLGIVRFSKFHSCKELEEEAHTYVLDNFSQVMDQEEFLRLSLEELLSYLGSDKIDVRTEESVFLGAIKWINFSEPISIEQIDSGKSLDDNLTSRLSSLVDVLKAVRLATIDYDFLTSIILHHPLIEADLKATEIVEDAIKYVVMSKDTNTRRRQSLQTELSNHPRPSTIAKEVMVLVGGHNQHVLQSVIFYDPGRDKWAELPPLPYNVLWYSMVVLENDVYVTGGVRENVVVAEAWHFNTRSRIWSAIAPMLYPRSKHSSVSSIIDDIGNLIIFGGYTLQGGIKALEEIECYSLMTEQWTVIGTTSMPRALSKIIPYKNTLIEIGGTQANGRVKTMDIYHIISDLTSTKISDDASSDISSHLSNLSVSDSVNDFEQKITISLSGEQFILPEPIEYAQFVRISNQFYIIWEDTKKFISLDPERRIFRRLPDLVYSHVNGSATVVNGKIYVSGGLHQSTPTRIVECYTPELNVWTITKSLPQARACHGAVTLQM